MFALLISITVIGLVTFGVFKLGMRYARKAQPMAIRLEDLE